VKRQSLIKVACETCGAAIRRATGWPICTACWDVAYGAFRREHAGIGGDAWQTAWNAFFTDRAAVVAAIRAEQAARRAAA
jgi:hypothetical protein